MSLRQTAGRAWLPHSSLYRKYLGYHAFSRYIASDDDFLVLRRFDTLHCRILLKLQDELAQLEEELDLLDAHFSEKGTKDVDNGSLRRDQQTRKDVLVLIAAKLEQYGMCQTIPTCAQTSVTLNGTLCYRVCP